jgi:WD40 repeat protein
VTHPEHARKVLDALLATRRAVDGTTQWEHAAPYLLEHIFQHAAEAGRVDELLSDAELLSCANPAGVVPELDAAVTAQGRLVRAIYRASLGRHRTADAEVRRRVLALDAQRLGDPALAERLARRSDARWRVRWGTGSQVSPSLRGAHVGHDNPVRAIVCAQVGERAVALTGGPDEPARIWDLATGTPLGRPGDDRTGPVLAAVVATIRGDPVGITGGTGGLRQWNLRTGYPLPERVLDHLGTVTAVAVMPDRPVVVAGTSNGTLQAWDLLARAPASAPWPGHLGAVRSIAVGEVEGRWLTVTAARDGVRSFDAATGNHFGGPWPDVEGRVWSVNLLRYGGVDAALIGDRVGLRLWRLTAGLPTGEPVLIWADELTCAALGEVDGRPIVVTGGDDGLVRVVDIRSGQPLGQHWRGHVGPVEAIAVGSLRQRPVAVSGGDDGSVCVWDLDDASSVGQPHPGHNDEVLAVAATRLNGKTIAITGGGARDGTARVWDVVTGDPVVTLRPEHHEGVPALAATRLRGRPVVIAADDDVVRLYDAATGAAVGEPWRGHAGMVTSIAVLRWDGRQLVVTGSTDATIRAWEPLTGEPLAGPWQGQIRPVTALAAAVVEGRPVVVSGDGDATIRVWNVVTGRPSAAAWRGHDGGVSALMITRVDNRPVVISGGEDATVRVWDLATGESVGEPWRAHNEAVTAMVTASMYGAPVVITAGDVTVRVWRPQDARLLEVIPMPSRVRALAMADTGELLVGTGWEVIVLEPVPGGGHR